MPLKLDDLHIYNQKGMMYHWLESLNTLSVNNYNFWLILGNKTDIVGLNLTRLSCDVYPPVFLPLWSFPKASTFLRSSTQGAQEQAEQEQQNKPVED